MAWIVTTFDPGGCVIRTETFILEAKLINYVVMLARRVPPGCKITIENALNH